MNTVSGMVPDSESTVTPERHTLLRPPTKALAGPSVNARLYAYTAHRMVISEVMAKHCMSTDRTFLLRTMPA